MRLNPVKEASFPLLVSEGYKKTSPATRDYNCIAFAADVMDEWWWPDASGDGAWPEGVPRETTRAAFVAAYGTLGYKPCKDGKLEKGYEKIALYEKDGAPTHASKQLPDGRWKSKLGQWEDIEHNTTRAVETHQGVGVYGSVALYFKRKNK